MKTFVSLVSLLSFITLSAQAADLAYKYRWSNGAYRCVNSAGQQGYNENYFGECGQVSGLNFESIKANQSISGLQSVETVYQKADFSGGGLVDCNFERAELINANMNSMRIYATKLSGAQMERASFVGALITKASYNNADLKNSVFWNSSIGYSHFNGAILYFATFEGALLKNVSFENADARESSFAHTVLNQTNFKNADLRGAIFDKAHLNEGNVWTGAKFDQFSRLPFSREEAEAKGMIFVE